MPAITDMELYDTIFTINRKEGSKRIRILYHIQLGNANEPSKISEIEFDEVFLCQNTLEDFNKQVMNDVLDQWTQCHLEFSSNLNLRII